MLTFAVQPRRGIMANYSAADIRSFVLETLRVSGAAYREVDSIAASGSHRGDSTDLL